MQVYSVCLGSLKQSKNVQVRCTRDSKLPTGMNVSLLAWQPVQGVPLLSAKCMLG